MSKSKKSISKQDKWLSKLNEQRSYEIKDATEKFYDSNYGLVDFSFSSEQEPLADLCTLAKAPSAPHTLTQDQLRERCEQIRSNIKLGISDNIEVQLNKGRQMSGLLYGKPSSLLLGNIVVKIVPMDVGKSKHLFIKDGDTLDAAIFLGGEYGSGIMLITDEYGDDYFLRLDEFYLFSIDPKSNPEKQVAILTSYNWLTKKVYTTVFCAVSCYPIVSLLLSDWIKEEWKRAKDAATGSFNKEIGGDTNEQKQITG